MTQDERFARVQKIDGELRTLQCILSTLQWDQEIYMPAQALSERAEHLEFVTLLSHARYTSQTLADDLAALGCSEETPAGDPAFDEDRRALLKVLYREQQRKLRLPEVLVGEIAQETSRAFATWRKAREANSFAVFAPSLEKLVALSREVAEYIGYEGEPYDALLSEYEPDMTTAQVSELFDPLQAFLSDTIGKIAAQEAIDAKHLEYDVPEEAQKAFNHELLAGLGFDLQRGRMDVSAHPFTTTLGSDDVRITTRYHEYIEAIFGTIHEFGHALYELQVDKKWRGSSLAEGANLSVHESQSRLWENLVGRSMAFWEFWFPKLRASYGSHFDSMSLEDFWRAVNRVDPGLVRVSADEVSYNLHIILRFNIERLLISGQLEAKHASELWNDLSRTLLGTDPKDDVHGVLQDIHWSHASFGYFPTYALGNLCSTQIYQVLRKDIPDLDTYLRKGEYAPLSSWLEAHIHRFGRSKSTNEILSSISGEPLSAKSYTQYIEKKYRAVYGF